MSLSYRPHRVSAPPPGCITTTLLSVSVNHRAYSMPVSGIRAAPWQAASSHVDIQNSAKWRFCVNAARKSAILHQKPAALTRRTLQNELFMSTRQSILEREAYAAHDAAAGHGIARHHVVAAVKKVAANYTELQ